MSLKDQITEDMKSAMRAKETARLGTIRLLLAAIKQREVDDRIVLDDAAVISTVEKMIKQRKDSIPQSEAGGRADEIAPVHMQYSTTAGSASSAAATRPAAASSMRWRWL
mgnify:CR=1 FL=1